MGSIGLGEIALLGVMGLVFLGVPVAIVVIVVLLRRKPTATK